MTRTRSILSSLLLAVCALGACAGGHVFAVRKLQKRVAPSGKPKLAPMIDRLGLTRAWLIIAGVTAALLSLLVAGLTTWIFPAG